MHWRIYLRGEIREESDIVYSSCALFSMPFNKLVELNYLKLTDEKWLLNQKCEEPKSLKNIGTHKTGLVASPICNKELYSNIRLLFKIICIVTLPAVSTSIPERTFLYLKRLKTYLRNYMTVILIIKYLGVDIRVVNEI